MANGFIEEIKAILVEKFGEYSDDVFEKSLLLRYLETKTRSANKGSKSRSSFANLYAIYVLVEDYINRGFIDSGKYDKYETYHRIRPR